MTLETSVYTAHRGYNWSRTPDGLSVRRLNQLHRMASASRGAFPNPLSIDIGAVSDGKIAAAYTIRNVSSWDAEKRSCEYAAFAFFPVSRADEIDFIELINNDFFWTPSRRPRASIIYEGPAAIRTPPSVRRNLQEHRALLLKNPQALGSVLATFAANSTGWACRLMEDNLMRIECKDWTDVKGA